MACEKEHRYDSLFDNLPFDQSGAGRHRCAGCAYDKGYKDGLKRKEQLNLELDSLPMSQAGFVRHRSPHAAYALGYLKGVEDSY
ncbi:hypothetical protein EZS27_010945 [termite gut metagenome]|uniref:Uncharacterized protein n=1 Tax=termite gut metagenome TaxID=433724 RepID=A0A5J4S7C4_9ZZZZ